jgi:hypothetical protein
MGQDQILPLNLEAHFDQWDGRMGWKNYASLYETTNFFKSKINREFLLQKPTSVIFMCIFVVFFFVVVCIAD